MLYGEIKADGDQAILEVKEKEIVTNDRTSITARRYDSVIIKLPSTVYHEDRWFGKRIEPNNAQAFPPKNTSLSELENRL